MAEIRVVMSVLGRTLASEVGMSVLPHLADILSGSINFR